jgi:hypothetical protein
MRVMSVRREFRERRIVNRAWRPERREHIRGREANRD